MKKTPIFGRDAYTLDAVIEAGVPREAAVTLLADGVRCVPEHPRLHLKGRGRGKLTTHYVWGSDANTLLREKR